MPERDNRRIKTEQVRQQPPRLSFVQSSAHPAEAFSGSLWKGKLDANHAFAVALLRKHPGSRMK